MNITTYLFAILLTFSILICNVNISAQIQDIKSNNKTTSEYSPKNLPENSSNKSSFVEDMSTGCIEGCISGFISLLFDGCVNAIFSGSNKSDNNYEYYVNSTDNNDIHNSPMTKLKNQTPPNFNVSNNKKL